MTQESGTRSRPNYLPYVLIVVGVLVLVGNLTGGFGSVFRLALAVLNLWPIVLIAVGVDLITGGAYRPIVAAAAVVLGLLLLFAPFDLGGRMGGAGVAHDVAVPFDGATSAEVSIDLGVASLLLGSSPSTTMVVSGTVTPSRSERFEQSSRLRGQTLVVDLKSARARGLFGFGGVGDVGRGGWDLALTQHLPMALDVDTGVGESNLDLRALRLTAFDLDAGVGSVTVTLPAGTYRASIDGGVGNVTLRLPEGTPARVTVDTGLGTVATDSGYQRSGDVYTTASYAGSGLEVIVSAGVGQVRLETVR